MNGLWKSSFTGNDDPIKLLPRASIISNANPILSYLSLSLLIMVCNVCTKKSASNEVAQELKINPADRATWEMEKSPSSLDGKQHGGEVIRNRIKHSHGRT